MELSDSYSHSNSKLLKWSPNGKYLAVVNKSRLMIRDAENLQIHRLYSCLGEIQDISWNKQSDFILCGIYKKKLVQIFSIQDSEWNCRIDENLAGISKAKWTPDGRNIMTISDFQVSFY